MFKILFIEDDPDQIFLYNSVFEMEGWLLLTAANLKDTVNIINRDKPDLILLDLMLGEIDGLEILKKIKTDPEMKKIPVVVFTNFERKGIKEEALSLGAEDFILKVKITPGELIAKIKEKYLPAAK